MDSIPDSRSLRDHGPYSAYCKVCWYSVYKAWIDEEPHHGVCPFGHFSAASCPEARNRASDAAGLMAALACAQPNRRS